MEKHDWPEEEFGAQTPGQPKDDPSPDDPEKQADGHQSGAGKEETNHMKNARHKFTEDQAEPRTHGVEEESGDDPRFDTPAPELQALEAANQELKDKYLRLFAEFDNYKKRTIREKIELMNTAAQDTLAALLPVLDDFDRAKRIADDPKTGETLSEGVALVYNKLYATLKQKGLEPMDSDGQDFDPELHEAVTEIPAPSPELKGKVVDTIEKGYTLNDRIIRHAKVVVGK